MQAPIHEWDSALMARRTLVIGPFRATLSSLPAESSLLRGGSRTGLLEVRSCSWGERSSDAGEVHLRYETSFNGRPDPAAAANAVQQ
mmetsp:Transcript_11999/g.28707  ORF Transcript_11999/g.28707 Transcript_11999/m.28707 type:complete len:87 (+) Transcript_11999:487-747(+)